MPRRLGLPRPLGRAMPGRARRRAGDLVPVRLVLLAKPRLHLAAQAVRLGARPRLVLRRALLDGVDLVVRLAQLDVRVVEPRLQHLLALGRLLAVLAQLGDLLVGGHQVPLEPDRALLRSRRARPARGSCSCGRGSAPPWRPARPQIEDVFSSLLMILCRPRYSRSFEKVAEARTARAPPRSLAQRQASFSSEPIRAASSVLRASARRRVRRCGARSSRRSSGRSLGRDVPRR